MLFKFLENMIFFKLDSKNFKSTLQICLCGIFNVLTANILILLSAKATSLTNI